MKRLAAAAVMLSAGAMLVGCASKPEISATGSPELEKNQPPVHFTGNPNQLQGPMKKPGTAPHGNAASAGH